jgi:hypothetical protein
MLSNPGTPRRRPTLKSCLPIQIIRGLPFLQPKLEQLSRRLDPRRSAMHRHQTLLSYRRPNGLSPPLRMPRRPTQPNGLILIRKRQGGCQTFEEGSMSPNLLQQRMRL